MAEKTNITRIKASDSASKSAKATEPTKKKAVKAPRVRRERSTRNPFMRMLGRIGAYFAGAWVELRQVRWPDRKATWSLTVAVIAFSLAFTAVILALDALFKYIFQLIIA